MGLLRTYDLRLLATPSRVVIRPFHLAPEPRDLNPTQAGRAHRIIEAVRAMSDAEAARELAAVDADFATRHWQSRLVHRTRFERLARELGIGEALSEDKRLLIGAFFCHEYSYAAAAIMNPSIVPHTDQSGLMEGDQRFILSVRTVGEGHISSIAFREGILKADGELNLWPLPDLTIAAESEDGGADRAVIARRPPTVPISGLVIFPFTRAQRNGLEDLRLVRFDDEGEEVYYGTYTAYSGAEVRSELFTTRDFTTFSLETMEGEAARHKGMALFPRRIDGAYAMIGRQDGESIFFMQSDDLRRWDGGVRILAPTFPWELVQIGNCGSPIELDEGWLVLTHGVGAMRKYAIGAALLDKRDPTKVLGRLAEPLLSPLNENREGYVPNVVYTCGAMKHGDRLFMPFGVADSSVSFALVEIRSLLADMR
ncbi:MAG: glycoside hydrolase family 130 protein [Hyphomonadaceae bacterium]|nr:glycoside hydrolase family 130 protein [Hyphomonadaceae bacterium]